MGKVIDLTGQKFGRLTAICRAENKGKQTAWKCRCDCGNIVVVLGSNLRKGNTQSCGCYKKEKSTKHGMYLDPLYTTYTSMISRTTNPKNKKIPKLRCEGNKSLQAVVRF